MPKGVGRAASTKYDASYKGFFAQRRTVADTLLGAARGIARHLDFSTLERLPASFVTENLGQRHADMLWRIRTTDAEWLYLMVLLEFQSTIDRRMALRMTDYTVRVLRGLGRDELGPRNEYPVVLPVVVYNGEQRWTAATDIRDLFGRVPMELLGYLPRHRYLLIAVQELDPGALPDDSVLAMIARLEQASTPEAVEELVAPLAKVLRQIAEPELAETFRGWIRLVVLRRFGSRGRELTHKLDKEEEGQMTTLLDRARQWGEERDQLWLEKGIAKGRIEGERELVHRMVTRRFGPRTAEHVLARLNNLSDPEDIAALADAVIECQTAAEFLERVRDA